MPRRRRWTIAVTGLVAVALLAVGCDAKSGEQHGVVAVLEAPTAGVTSPSTATTASPPPVHQGAAVTKTGVVVPVLGAAEDGWVVGTPCGRTATVQGARPLQGTVVLDPGHGGKETGAIGPLGTKESDLNLALVAYVQDALKDQGISAIPTRTRDYRIAISSRAAIVEAVRPKAFVSIHHNAAPSHLGAAPGTEIFHQAVGESAAESRRLSGLIHEEVTAVLAKLDVAEWATTPRPGVKPRRNAAGDDFYGVLRRTQGTPTALAELGFISHEAEEQRYREPKVQQQVGGAVARGIVRFLTTPDPGSGFVVPPNLADDPRQGGGTANCDDPPLD